MLLSEFKSKELLAQYGVRVPPARLARSVEEAEAACATLDARKYVVKAQIAAGGRALAGGVRFAATPSGVADEARRLLGSSLVTEQTGPEGEKVTTVSVEAALDLELQAYLAFARDPDSGAPLLLTAAEGGVEFEERARAESDLVRTLVVERDDDASRAEVADLLSGLGIDGAGAVDQVFAAHLAFVSSDMTLLEINPFARVAGGAWLAVDGKVALDASALFRHPEFEALATDPGVFLRDAEAQKNNINLVTLTGDIGVVVNGAGLGLATNDMLIDAGGRPANFMDIRTTASSFDIAKGVELLLEAPEVKAILLNVHGGGMTVCDTVAEGVAFAYSRAERRPPVIARLAGQNAPWGLQILKDRKVPVEVFDTMPDAVARVVELTGGAR